MTQHLLLSIRFLDDRYHGQTENGEKNEWPPSPFRLFQALIAGNARGGRIPGNLREALLWLERLDPPSILAPVAHNGTEVLTYVLNNTSDSEWPASRAPKTIRPTLLNGDRLVQYGWTYDPTQPNVATHAKSIADASRHITCLGWGIDLAVGSGEHAAAKLPEPTDKRVLHRPIQGKTYQPEQTWRVPIPGSLVSLERTYREFMSRYEQPGVTKFESAPTYGRQSYACGPTRSYVAFRLRRADEEDQRPAYLRTQQIAPLVGMLRHLVAEHARALATPDSVAAEVLGHPLTVGASGLADETDNPDARGVAGGNRLSFLTLPTVRDGPTDGRIRRVMLAEPLDTDGVWCREMEQRLDGEMLRPKENEKDPWLSGLCLERIRGQDQVLSRYLGPSYSWASATPVLLPGYDDRKQHRGDQRRRMARAGQLLCKALKHAGIEVSAHFELSKVPYLSGALHAGNYQPRGKLRHYPCYHVRIAFDRPVHGPLAIGAGRHCGFGVLATIDD